MFGFEDVQQYRLFLKGQQMHILDDDCASCRLVKVSLYAVVDFTALIFGIMPTYESRTSGIDHSYWFLLPRTVEVDLVCHLLFARTALSEDDCVGVGRGNSRYLFLNLLPYLAFAR